MGKLESQVFPIKNAAACVYKWSWNTFRLINAKSSSCHRVDPVTVPLDDFENFHNTPAVLEDRGKMLSGQWPGRGCEYCQTVEQYGGISDRLYHNNIPGLTPVDFGTTQDHRVTPRVVELYISNVCDLACLYCLPVYSSRNNQELRTFGPYPIGIQAIEEIPQRDLYFARWLSWFAANHNKVGRLSILGGEPLLQKELNDVLALIEQHRHNDLTLAITTNLNCKSKVLTTFVERCYTMLANRHISGVDVDVSIDCWGQQAEFIRNGLNLSQWQENFEYLISHKWINVSVHQVLTSLSLDTAIDLQKRIAGYKQLNPKILQAYHVVDSGFDEIYHPEIFGNEFFQHQFNQLVETYPISTEWDEHAKQRLIGIAKLQQTASPNPQRLNKLRVTLDMIDQRRGTDWRKLFPRISEYFQNNHVV